MPNRRPFSVQAGQSIRLDGFGAQKATWHLFDQDSIDAVNAALLARRALLIRGEPGIGKSQLARAAAQVLNRAYFPFTVDSLTEARDLKYTVDAVARLAEAQILGQPQETGRSSKDSKKVAKDGDGAVQEDSPEKKPLNVSQRVAEWRFTAPGPLWWLYDWSFAQRRVKQAVVQCPQPWVEGGARHENGMVLLIDEIDKADPAVPNGLLEALGQGQFQVPGGEVVRASAGQPPPLVIITSNDERTLPDAFVRRCFVLKMRWPTNDKKLMIDLVARGKTHLPDLDDREPLDGEEPNLLWAAAAMVVKDRDAHRAAGVCPPGGAEYLDLVRAVLAMSDGSRESEREILTRLRPFALRKHLDEDRANRLPSKEQPGPA